ncbi:replication initiator protein A [Allosediminivita pacifica]|uniref:Plasmid replication initiation protein n=1 Tax=Allosediminivita pacifica TaxID=1267769 RepID=A0A2T6A9A1_9RHOB|nr:replication initiator protein A [Allosediminivita pacifica]PTX40370.1 plasmid replication initiation protein [Allosediminivita pacifica]GGB26326.1 plasmid replication initiator protein RepA [Allosediminivita pacifica]
MGAGTGEPGRELLPERHPQMDFFLCDVFDAIPKDDMATMEHPVFSLATRPDRRILRYEHNGAQVEVTPSVKGLATIHDKDILIFCISQLMAAINAGRQVGRTLTLRAHDLLVATNRETSGDAYRRLREAFERLAGTRITTNIATGETETTTGFGLIERWEITRRSRGGRMMSVSVTLSEWLYRAVLAKSVLTLSRDYFRLRKPLERRIYELARKHCGRQSSWRISVETLLKKSGSASPRRVFRKMLRDMIASDHLPDYHMAEEEGDMIRFTRRRKTEDAGTDAPPVSPAALEEARRLMPGVDIYALEAEWRAFWAGSGRPRLRSADGAFLGFVRVRAKR